MEFHKNLLFTAIAFIAMSTMPSSIYASDWHKYSNIELGFSINHPPEAQISTRTDTSYKYVRIVTYDNSGPTWEKRTLNPGEFLLEVFVTPKKDLEAKRSNRDCTEIPNAKRIAVGDIQGYRSGFDNDEGEGYVESLCVKTDTKMYKVNALGPYDHLEDVRKMLDSFKLITASTSVPQNSDTQNTSTSHKTSAPSTKKSVPQRVLTIGDAIFDLDRLEKQGKYEMPTVERRGTNYERRVKYLPHSKHIAFIETAMYDDNYDGTLRIYNLKGDLLLEKPESSMGFDEVAEIGSGQVATIVNNVFVGGGHLDIYNISDSEVVFSTPCEMGKCNLEASPSGDYIVFTRRDFDSNYIEYYTYDLNGLKQIATGNNFYCVFSSISSKSYLLIKSQGIATQNPSDKERPKVEISYYSNYKKQWDTTLKSQWLNASFSRSEKYVIVELVNDRVIKDNRLVSQDVAFSIIDTSKGTTISEGKISPEIVEKYKQETI